MRRTGSLVALAVAVVLMAVWGQTFAAGISPVLDRIQANKELVVGQRLACPR